MSGDQFRCVATNSVSSVTSIAATLTVNLASIAPAVTTLTVSPEISESGGFAITESLAVRPETTSTSWIAG